LLSTERSESAQQPHDEDAVDRVHLLRQLYSADLDSTTIAGWCPTPPSTALGALPECAVTASRAGRSPSARWSFRRFPTWASTAPVSGTTWKAAGRGRCSPLDN